MPNKTNQTVDNFLEGLDEVVIPEDEEGADGTNITVETEDNPEKVIEEQPAQEEKEPAPEMFPHKVKVLGEEKEITMDEAIAAIQKGLAYDEMKAFFSSMGLDVLEMSAEEHDEEAAYSQGVTHFVGRTLDQMGMKPTPIATQGYRNLMTIVEQTCNDPLQLFYDLQRFNPYAKEMRLSLQVAIEKVLNALRREEG